VTALSNFQNAIDKIGPFGTIGLIIRKISRRIRYRSMIRRIPHSSDIAVLSARNVNAVEISEEERWNILQKADAMLRDENRFFTFSYKTRDVERPWEFDPIEKKYWPTRHYTERHLHGPDTPRDVKIIWEINRFKDLPTLGQAAFLTRDEQYAIEAERRILSWIEENPFASTINWASALEISIRLLSWSATLFLLRSAGFNVCENKRIARSIYEQLKYLAADLSTDKVIPTNHLIGEAAGLFVAASLWDVRGSKSLQQKTRRILEREIIRQTYEDGVTQEASSWYHQFVTHFLDLADRVAATSSHQLSVRFQNRLSKMKTYLETMIVNGEAIRYGDADDGWALWLEGNLNTWKNKIFGLPTTDTAKSSHYYYPTSDVAAARFQGSFLFLRAGQFGMGGAGFSSHAHDDFLGPIIYLDAIPVLVDPGTIVYNGNPTRRAEFRGANAHNGIIVGESTGAVQRMNFGWNRVRPNAKILETSFTAQEASVTAQYGEWPVHKRSVKINQKAALIVDRFSVPLHKPCEWWLHFAPAWSIEKQSDTEYTCVTNAGDHLSIKLSGLFESMEVQSYDYSPSYGVAVPATMLRLSSSAPEGVFEILMTIDRL
jgi:hypothetical protein